MAVVIQGVYVYQQEEKDCWSQGYGARWERRRDGLWRQEVSETEGEPWERVGEPMGISDAVRFSIGYDKAEAEEAARSQAALQGPPVGDASGPGAGGVTPLPVVAPTVAGWMPYSHKDGLEGFADRLEAEVEFLGRELRRSQEEPCEGRDATRAAIARERRLQRWRRKLDRMLAEVSEWL